MSQSTQSSALNFDSLSAEQFVNLIGLDEFNRTVALKHYKKASNNSFEKWYEIFEKGGITLPMENDVVVKRDRSDFISVAIEEVVEESKDQLEEVVKENIEETNKD